MLYPKYTEINNIIFGVDKNKLYQLNISAFVAGALKYKNTIIVGTKNTLSGESDNTLSEENDYVTT